MEKFLLPILLAGIILASGTRASKLDILILAEQFPDTDMAFLETLKKSLESQGIAANFVRADALPSELSKKAERRLLILPNSAYFPLNARQALMDYVARCGNLLTIGGPPLSKQVVNLNGEWLTCQMLLDKLATMPPGKMLLDFEKLKLSDAFRDTGTQGVKVEVRTVPTGFPDAPFALELKVPSVKYWEFQDIPVQNSFPAGETVTTFWAKGSEN
ncbi:MAG: hypothetical protein QME62_13760, partial [Armatimonadota bacterium]|nr:hypothetical protein [Armatimonadota bacterium]